MQREMSLDKNISKAIHQLKKGLHNVLLMFEFSEFKKVQVHKQQASLWNPRLLFFHAALFFSHSCCLPSINCDWEEKKKPSLIKAGHLYWAPHFCLYGEVSQWQDVEILEIGGCTVRVPDSHCPSPHFRSIGKRLMLRYLQSGGREKEQGGGNQSF